MKPLRRVSVIAEKSTALDTLDGASEGTRIQSTQTKIVLKKILIVIQYYYTLYTFIFFEHHRCQRLRTPTNPNIYIYKNPDCKLLYMIYNVVVFFSFERERGVSHL